MAVKYFKTKGGDILTSKSDDNIRELYKGRYTEVDKNGKEKKKAAKK